HRSVPWPLTSTPPARWFAPDVVATPAVHDRPEPQALPLTVPVRCREREHPRRLGARQRTTLDQDAGACRLLTAHTGAPVLVRRRLPVGKESVDDPVGLGRVGGVYLVRLDVGRARVGVAVCSFGRADC